MNVPDYVARQVSIQQDYFAKELTQRTINLSKLRDLGHINDHNKGNNLLKVLK